MLVVTRWGVWCVVATLVEFDCEEQDNQTGDEDPPQAENGRPLVGRKLGGLIATTVVRKSVHRIDGVAGVSVSVGVGVSVSLVGKVDG